MTRGKIIWLVVSIGLSFGANRSLKPRHDYASYSEGHTLPTGEVVLSGDARVGVKLVDMRVIATDVQTPIGRTLPVRVLLLRSALADGVLDPDLELFVDLTPPGGAPLDPGARNIELLRGRPLPVLPQAPASEALSRVRLPGSEGAATVQRGTFSITDALLIGPGDWRVRGELDLELSDAGTTRAAIARVVGKVIWD